ncbi:MAG: Rnase Y domain-containing protein, partial [Planctomycetota bacterium JB042]
MDPISLVVGALIGAAILALSLAAFRASLVRRQESVLAEARAKADAIVREAEIRSRDEELRRREEDDRRGALRSEEAERRERRLGEQEAAFDRRAERLDERERELAGRARAVEDGEADLEAARIELETLRARARDELLETAGLSRDEAVRRATERIDDELAAERAERVRRSVERAEEEAEERARKILSRAVQRLSVPYTLESTTSAVTLPNDAMKGRLIGREGRNIRTFEKMTGVDLIIDDTPAVVVVSCFDAVRREVARRSLEVLVEDGRVHPGRIEEVVAQTRRQIDEDI